MKNLLLSNRNMLPLLIMALTLAAAGCSSTKTQSSSTTAPTGSEVKVKAPDGRTVNIGKPSPAAGGISYKEPHMEACWIADGFDFNGYDTLCITPTLSTAKVNPDGAKVHEIAKENLPAELARTVRSVNLFANVVTHETEIKPGAKVLKLENTITEFAKGGGGARFWAGLYGAGQPVLRVAGKMMDGSKTVFTFEMRRSGVSGNARMGGGFMKDEDVQIEDIRSLALDLTDFMAVVAKKPPVNTKELYP